MNTHINQQIFKSFPVLETERLMLRQFRFDDIADFFAIRSNPVVMQYMDSFPHQNHNESGTMIVQMEESFRNKTGINWAIELVSSRKLIGYIGLWRLIYENVRAELGYALNHEYWGNGYMNEALTEVIRFSFEDFHLHSIEASVNPLNMKSISLLKKAGFTKQAHFRENFYFDGHFLDSFVFCLTESNFLQF